MRSRLERIAAQLIEAYAASGAGTPGGIGPPELAEVLDQLFAAFDQIDQELGPGVSLSYQEATNLGDQAFARLHDLALWAERLSLPGEKQAIEDLTLETAHWVLRHGGALRILEPVVNALAACANRTQDPQALKALFHLASDIIENAAPEIRADSDKSDPGRPWRILHFNFAIIATRTQDRKLMVQAYDTLGAALPEDCPVFFEEALRQAQKPVYGPEVRVLTQEYFSRWTVRH